MTTLGFAPSESLLLLENFGELDWFVKEVQRSELNKRRLKQIEIAEAVKMGTQAVGSKEGNKYYELWRKAKLNEITKKEVKKTLFQLVKEKVGEKTLFQRLKE